MIREVGVDLSSHIQIISQLLQTRKWNGCIHSEKCEQPQSWMSDVALLSGYMWAWTNSRVCPTRNCACLLKLCSEVVKSAAHASMPLMNQPLQGSEEIYILLMLCTARDAHISLLHTRIVTFTYVDTAHGVHTHSDTLCRPLLTPSAICVAEELCARINRRGQYLPVASIREECNVCALNRLIKYVWEHTLPLQDIFFCAAILWRQTL